MEGLDEKFPGKHFHFQLFFSLKEDIDIIFLNIFPISVFFKTGCCRPEIIQKVMCAYVDANDLLTH